MCLRDQLDLFFDAALDPAGLPVNMVHVENGQMRDLSQMAGEGRFARAGLTDDHNALHLGVAGGSLINEAPRIEVERLSGKHALVVEIGNGEHLMAFKYVLDSEMQILLARQR